MAMFPCATCHLKEQEVKPLTPCVSCHANRTELHLKATHSATHCTVCHIPHQWTVTKREVCYTCHPDKANHIQSGFCRDCHPFRQAAKAS